MRTRTEAACLRSSIADLHEQLGRSIANGRPTFHAGDHSFNVTDEHFRDLTVDASVRRIIPHALPDTPEVRALRLDWEQTEAAAQEAWERFKVHHNPKRYRAEMALISSSGALA